MSDVKIENWIKKKEEYSKMKKEPLERVAFNDYFMGLAFAVSKRSADAQTHHGTLIVDENKHIVSTGYNSFPRKMPDEIMPNLRPEKHRWMIHSEICALSNITISPWQSRKLTAFITGKPCLPCITTLYNSGIENYVIADRPGWSRDGEQSEDWDFFVTEQKINIVKIKPNLNWIKQLAKELEDYGYIDT